MDRKGSILITVLWVLILLTFLTVAMANRFRTEAKTTGLYLRAQEQREALETGVEFARYLLSLDSDVLEDGPLDVWYGEHTTEQWLGKDAGDLSVQIIDEQSKINVNYVPAGILLNLVALLQGKGASLGASSENLAAGISRWRGLTPLFGSPSSYHHKQRPFESLEELLLVEHMTPEAFERLSPYLTVYARPGERQLRVNINTASEVVLEAIFLDLTGDSFARSQFRSKLYEYRQEQMDAGATAFGREDLNTSTLLNKLKLPLTIQIIGVVEQFLLYMTVDSTCFEVRVQAPARLLPRQVKAILGPYGSKQNPLGKQQMTVQGPAYFRRNTLEVLNWSESY